MIDSYPLENNQDRTLKISKEQSKETEKIRYKECSAQQDMEDI